MKKNYDEVLISIVRIVEDAIRTSDNLIEDGFDDTDSFRS